jgi:hypothetical protein
MSRFSSSFLNILEWSGLWLINLTIFRF